MTTITATDKDLIVCYKAAGKLYRVNGEAGTGEPFDEVTVKAGTSIEIYGDVLHVRELGEVVQDPHQHDQAGG